MTTIDIERSNVLLAQKWAVEQFRKELPNSDCNFVAIGNDFDCVELVAMPLHTENLRFISELKKLINDACDKHLLQLKQTMFEM